MNQTNNNNNALIAFVGGVVAGAALGVLLAPGKSSDTLKRVADTAQRVGGDVLAAAGKVSQLKDKFVHGDFLQKAEVMIEGMAVAKELKAKFQGEDTGSHQTPESHESHESRSSRSEDTGKSGLNAGNSNTHSKGSKSTSR